MKKMTYFVLLVLMQLVATPAFAENRAVKINIGSTGGALDNNALREVRKLIGQAIVNETVDTFKVLSPKVGGPMLREGGLSACAEAGFSASPQKFNVLIKKLGAIHPKQGTFLNLEPASNCSGNETLSCGGITGQQCPTGQTCVDDPQDSCDPNHGGADCSGLCVTKTDYKPDTPVSCGGFTAKKCPSDQVCVDDPKDDCNPNKGGADCIGLCAAKPK